MRRPAWLVLALLALFSLAPAAAQIGDPAPCLGKSDRGTVAACLKLIEGLTRIITLPQPGQLSPKARLVELYQSYNMRGGAYQAMARRYDADLDSQKAAELHLKAIADFDAAIRLDGSKPAAFLNRGSSRAELPALDDAIRDFEQVLSFEPKHPRALNNLGGAYGEKDDYQRAVAELNRAVALDPKYADALINRGSLHQQKKDYDSAIADFTAALKLGARDVYVWSARGRAWRENGDDKRAEADFKAALNVTATDKRTAVVQDAVRELLRAMQEKVQREEAAKRQKAELERIERERAERERAELRKAELERIERERAEKAALAQAEKAAREKEALESAARDRAEREKAAIEKATRDREARERAKLEQAAREQAAREKAELQKAAREKDAREKAEQAALQKAQQIALEKAAREKEARDREEREQAARDRAKASRVVLAIGNSAYSSKNLPPLKNPVNDAEAVAKAFEALDFTAMRSFNQTYAEMVGTLGRFAHAARKAETAVFFYAGHGLQHNEVNYLAPIDGDERDLKTFITLQSVMADLQSKDGVRILIIDACRSRPDAEMIESLNRPATRAMRGARGLAQMQRKDIPYGMYVAFAASPDQEAEDGVRSNSPFTSALVKYLPTPGLDVRLLFTRVRSEVIVDARGQHPQSYDSLVGEYAFKAVK